MLQMIRQRLYRLLLIPALTAGLFRPCAGAEAPDAYYLMNSSVEKIDQSIPMSEFMFPDEYERVLTEAEYHAGISL